MFLVSALIFLGAGCTNPLLGSEKNASDVVIEKDAKIQIEEMVMGFDNPLTKEPETEITILEKEFPSMSLAWTMTDRRETQASQEARQAAMNAPVGSETAMPEPIYEDVVRSGTLRADGLEAGKRISLPSFWSEGDQDLSGQENSLIWLSKSQYEQLVNTRQTIALFGGADSVLEGLLTYYQSAAAFAEKIQGNTRVVSLPDGYHEYIAITAEPEWGSYTLIYNNEKVRVQTIVAENVFARFEILANAENPLVLSVVPKPTSWLMNALESLHPGSVIKGFQVKSITTK